jgi:hypothetical protein
VAAILFCLRSRRRRTRNLDINHGNLHNDPPNHRPDIKQAVFDDPPKFPMPEDSMPPTRQSLWTADSSIHGTTAATPQTSMPTMLAANATAAAATLPSYLSHSHILPPVPDGEPIPGTRMRPNPPAPGFESPLSFPTIQNWLQSLDAGPRGADGHNFAQYAPHFHENGILRLHEIADESFSRKDLLAICPGMNFGTANILLMYARHDVKTIQQM